MYVTEENVSYEYSVIRELVLHLATPDLAEPYPYYYYYFWATYDRPCSKRKAD